VIKLMMKKACRTCRWSSEHYSARRRKVLRDNGVAAVYTPKNFDLNAIMTIWPTLSSVA